MSFLGGRGGNPAPSGGVNLEKVEMAVTEYVILVPISILLNATCEGSTQLPTFLTEWSSKRFETQILILFSQR